MAKNLVIVESPAKARTVARYLGSDYEVIASLGHVRDLPSGNMGVEVEKEFTPTYEILKNKTKVVQELKKASKNSEAIYLATDPDREGEAISWHLVSAAGWGKRTTHRVVFHEITDVAIKEAFNNPREIDMKLVNAQQARRILDRLVGYQLSPLLWRKISGGRKLGLSAGRVQSVALRLVVDREEAIEAFTAKEYWTVKANLQRDGSDLPQNQRVEFSAALRGIKGQRKAIEMPSDASAREIVDALEGASYSVADVQLKEIRYKPSAPFTTSTLQQEAWRKLRFSARKTMSVAQQLYEGLSIGPDGAVGLITYMRTDSTNVGPDAVRETVAFIRTKYGAEYAPKTPRTYTKKTKGAQEAHEAIRPTAIEREPSVLQPHLNRDQARLYDLIWKRMTASQMSDAVADSTRVAINAEGSQSQGITYVFRLSGSVLKFPGYRALYLEDRDEPSAEDEDQAGLPKLTINDLLKCLGLNQEQHFTEPPPRFTEATLVRAMEEAGIGRPSTYAPILSIITDRNYATKDQGRFKPTQLGRVVCKQLTDHFPDVMDVGFTAAMEENLDDIANGEKQWIPVLKDFYGPFEEALNAAAEEMPRVKVEEKTDEICELCDLPMVIKTSRFGRFLACTGFPECRGKKSLLKSTGVTCPECNNSQLVERRGKGRTFYGCTAYPECTFTVSQRPLPEPCPECEGLLVASGRDNARCLKCAYRGPVPERELTEVGA